MFFQGGGNAAAVMEGRPREEPSACVRANELIKRSTFSFFFGQMQKRRLSQNWQTFDFFFFFLLENLRSHRSGQVAASSRLSEFTLSQRRPHSRSLDPGNFENSMLFLFNNSSKSNILHQTDTLGRLLLRCLPLLFFFISAAPSVPGMVLLITVIALGDPLW